MKVIRADHTLHFSKLPSGIYSLALGNVTQFRIGLMHTDDGIFLGIFEKGSYHFSQYCHGSYAAEKLNILVPDGNNIADFINDQLGLNVARQGRYEINLILPVPTSTETTTEMRG